MASLKVNREVSEIIFSFSNARILLLHTDAWVQYTSSMDSSGHVAYRRSVTVPCDHGMLLFTVGPAADDMPYTYEVYNDAYLYSNNNGLCILHPRYTGFQVGNHPFWAPMDPMQIHLTQLTDKNMHWISSRLVNPSGAHRAFDPKKVGDYTVIAKHDFYDAHFYQEVKATVNSWK